MAIFGRDRSFPYINLGSLLAFGKRGCRSFPDFPPTLCCLEKLEVWGILNGMLVPPSVHSVISPLISVEASIQTLCLMSLLWWHLCSGQRDASGALWGSGTAPLMCPSFRPSHTKQISWAAA